MRERTEIGTALESYIDSLWLEQELEAENQRLKRRLDILRRRKNVQSEN